MARYIDADELIEEIKSLKISLSGKDIFIDRAKESVLRVIDEQPTADVEEVVRCEKCIHSEDYNGRILCNKNAHIFDKNDFCSYGTPKERGGEK